VFQDKNNRKKFYNSNYIQFLKHFAEETYNELKEKYFKDSTIDEMHQLYCYANAILFKTLSSNIEANILNGLANSAFGTVGPCGSISILADNCTSGIEPLFAYEYKRKVRLGGEVKEYTYKHYIAQKHGGSKEDYINSESHSINYEQRIKIQAAAQRFTDTSISSTINLPNNASIEDIGNIYQMAFIRDLKGITVFRDGCKAGILEKTDDKKDTTTVTSTPVNDVEPKLFKKSLLNVEDAERYRVVWKKGKVYIIVSLDNNDNPIEIFAKLPRQAGLNKDGVFEQDKYNENTANWDCINRLISIMLRYNIPLSEIIDQLDKSSCSLVDAPGVIKRILLNYLDDNDRNNSTKFVDILEPPENGENSENGFNRTPCPVCGNKDLYTREGGCYTCKNCGYSKCE
jgi:ribonucleoside-diphosphate reductase alpha chain